MSLVTNALAAVVVCGLFVGGGWMLWPRSTGPDRLASQAARHRAIALTAFAFPLLFLFAWLKVSELLLALLAIVWGVSMVGLGLWHIVCAIREQREARLRNAALGWPAGRPPRHPGWGLAVVVVWTTVLCGLAADGGQPHSLLTGIASGIGVMTNTVITVIMAVWLVGAVAGLLYVVLMVVRRFRWRRSPDGF